MRLRLCSRSILHNPNDYPEPGRFNPERYLAPDGSLDPSVRDPRTACFGFGRRICPGRYFADNSLFLTISTLLATIHIVRAQDTSGIEMVPEVETMPGLLSLPKPFPWAVHSRGRQAEELLANSKGN
jgi:cytochrome P450